MGTTVNLTRLNFHVELKIILNYRATSAFCIGRYPGQIACSQMKNIITTNILKFTVFQRVPPLIFMLSKAFCTNSTLYGTKFCLKMSKEYVKNIKKDGQIGLIRLLLIKKTLIFSQDYLLSTLNRLPG